MPAQVQENKKNDDDLKNKQEAAKELGKIVSAAKELYAKVDQDKNGKISLGEIKEIVLPSADKSKVYQEKVKEYVETMSSALMSERRDWADVRSKEMDRALLNSNRLDLNGNRMDYPPLNLTQGNKLQPLEKLEGYKPEPLTNPKSQEIYLDKLLKLKKEADKKD